MGVNWNALAQAPNPGVAFTQSFEAARQRKQQEELQHVQFQNQQEDRQLQRQTLEQKQAMAEIEAKRDQIKTGAQIFRAAKERNPDAPDTEIYASILPTLQQMGYNTQGLPQPGDPQLPQYLQSIQAIADAFGEKGAQDPSRIREFEIAKRRGHIPQHVTYEQFLSAVQPAGQSPIVQPWNAQPVGGGGGGGEVIAEDDQGNQVRYNPESGQWEPLGGSGGNAGGGFPGGIDPLAPL